MMKQWAVAIYVELMSPTGEKFIVEAGRVYAANFDDAKEKAMKLALRTYPLPGYYGHLCSVMCLD